MKCYYCGKVIDENTKGIGSVSLYASGEKYAVYCSPDCMIKACGKIKRMVQKMSLEQILTIATLNAHSEDRERNKK